MEKVIIVMFLLKILYSIFPKGLHFGAMDTTVVSEKYLKISCCQLSVENLRKKCLINILFDEKRRNSHFSCEIFWRALANSATNCA